MNKMINRFIVILLLMTSSVFGKELRIDIYGNQSENFSFSIDLVFDKNDNLSPYQYIDIQEINNIKSLKLITGPGLLSTLNNEKEIFIYYNLNGVYRLGQGRVYTNEDHVRILMDSENWKNITHHLKYHNINDYQILNNIDNERDSNKWKEI